jgi:hypothetical protein
MGVRDAIHNIFMLTSQGVKRFGLFDENIYYAFCEGKHPACKLWPDPESASQPVLAACCHIHILAKCQRLRQL